MFETRNYWIRENSTESDTFCLTTDVVSTKLKSIKTSNTIQTEEHNSIT